MGVRGLLSHCKHVIKDADETIPGRRIGIDAFSLFFVFREERDAFRAYLVNLLESQHLLECVLDKKAQKEKREVVDERKQKRTDAQTKVTGVESFVASDEFSLLDEEQQKVLLKYREQKARDSWGVYYEYIQWFKGIAAELGISVVLAEEEADSILGKGDYDVVISSDSDILIAGARVLWIPHRNAKHSELSLDGFLKYTQIKLDQLYPLSFLAGCDVQPRKLVPFNTAIHLLRVYGTMHTISKKKPDILSSDDLELYEKYTTTIWK